jgi:phage N-6-adenine-methyltransferase
MTTALEKLTNAERWLSEAKSLEEFQQIHDIAAAADAYARAHRLGVDSENHAREIKFLAARRIGELVPPCPKGGDGGTPKSEVRTLTELPKQRLSEFRKLAEIPESEFRERMNHLKDRQEHITYSRVLRGDWYQSSESDNYPTPQWLFDILNDEFHFTLDVCASQDNHKCEHYFSVPENGLIQKWDAISFMNPPYGREIKAWMTKASEEAKIGNIIVCLVPARTDTEWWWENCIHGEIRFLRGRLQFIEGQAAPFPSAVVVLGRPSRVVWWDVQDASRI